VQPTAELAPLLSVQGTGGIGAVPFAISTDESPWVVTTQPTAELAPLLSVQGTGGIGAVPFAISTDESPWVVTTQPTAELAALLSVQGTGGIGAVPFAINTEESPWVVTTVFRPIAPVKTSMARTIADEMRDISASGGNGSQSALYPLLG